MSDVIPINRRGPAKPGPGRPKGSGGGGRSALRLREILIHHYSKKTIIGWFNKLDEKDKLWVLTRLEAKLPPPAEPNANRAIHVHIKQYITPGNGRADVAEFSQGAGETHDNAGVITTTVKTPLNS